KPSQPLGRKPPCDHKLDKPMAFPPLPSPKKINPKPAIIIKTIVTILIIANQNSNSPNALTDTKFAEANNTITITPGIQSGSSGNQYLMYSPTAITSLIPTTTHWNMLLQAVKYPATG